MELTELINKKENLIIRFSKLTEEALSKLELEKEEDLPLIMEKRDKLLDEMEIVYNKFNQLEIKSEDDSLKIKELEASLLSLNKNLQKKMEEHFKDLKKNIGKNKKAIKVNKAYQGQFEQSLYLDKKN